MIENYKEMFDKIVVPLQYQYDYPDLFGKYGSVEGHYMGEHWEWDEESLKNVTYEEIIEMIALANTYWVETYRDLCEHYERRLGIRCSSENE